MVLVILPLTEDFADMSGNVLSSLTSGSDLIAPGCVVHGYTATSVSVLQFFTMVEPVLRCLTSRFLISFAKCRARAFEFLGKAGTRTGLAGLCFTRPSCMRKYSFSLIVDFQMLSESI